MATKLRLHDVVDKSAPKFFGHLESIFSGDATLSRDDMMKPGDPGYTKIKGIIDSDLADRDYTSGSLGAQLTRLSVDSPAASSSKPPPPSYSQSVALGARDTRGDLSGWTHPYPARTPPPSSGGWTPPYSQRPAPVPSYARPVQPKPSAPFSVYRDPPSAAASPAGTTLDPSAFREIYEAPEKELKERLFQTMPDPFAAEHLIRDIDSNPEKVLRQALGSVPGLADAFERAKDAATTDEERSALERIVGKKDRKSGKASARTPLQSRSRNVLGSY